jgi:hypothetical protein
MTAPMDPRPDRDRPLPLSPAASSEAAWSSEIEQAFPSTLWAWQRVEIKPPARAKQQPAEGSPSRRRLSMRAMRALTPMVMRYRGGPECWWEITCRGQVYRAPGHMALHDVMRRIYGHY